MIELNKNYNEDCLEGMNRISDVSVDMVLCDLPYGTTQLKWDVCLPLDQLWEQWLRVSKTNAAIVLFSSQPFTTDLINSNRKMFKYEIVWDKVTKTNFYDAHRRPMKSHENILVFYRKQPTYNPQKQRVGAGTGRVRTNSDFAVTNGHFVGTCNRVSAENYRYVDDGTRFPGTIIQFCNWNGALFGDTKRAVKHPTQKPVELCEYLIKTYTNEGDTVLDNCMGSGTTAVACLNTGRNFIGFELDEKYWNLASERVVSAQRQLLTLNSQL